jgi:glycosyltransferase involved in cell wall biosynthesis
MRILWFSNTPSLASKKLGGDPNLGGWISALENQLSKVEGIELGIAFPFWNDSPETFTIDRTSYFTFPYPKDKGRIRGLKERWTYKIEPENTVDYYFSIIEQFKPDLIHVFGSERSYGLIQGKCRIPIIVQIQGNLTLCTEKWFSGISFNQVLKYSNKKNLVYGYGIFHQYYLLRKRSAIERTILANTKNVIGRTDWDRRITRVFAPESKYYHCDELLRDEFYSTRKWSMPERNNHIIFSILSPALYKGLEVLLKTAAILKASNSIDFEWYIAGVKGNEEIISVIEKSLDLKFQDNQVKFKGSVNARDLHASLLTSTCYVHPSHIENSPNSVCEAMISGLPIIATNAGGLPSIIKDGEDGILVQNDDPYALAGAVMELLNSPVKMKLFSENARQTAMVRHNPSKVIEDLLGIYENVLNS